MGTGNLGNNKELSMKQMIALSMMLLFTCQNAIAADDNTSQQIQLLNSQIQAQLATLHNDQEKQIQTLNKQIQAQLKQMKSDLEEQIKQLQTGGEAVPKTVLPK